MEPSVSMRPMHALIFVVLVTSGWVVSVGHLPQEQTQTDKNAIEAVRKKADQIKECPATEQVAEFKHKWVKVAWGPPLDVKFDVERTQSLMSPYKGTIRFSMPYSGGEQWKTQQQAEADKDLRQIFLSPVEYTLRISTESKLTLDSMRIKNTLNGTWSSYEPIHPERFCWISVLR